MRGRFGVRVGHGISFHGGIIVRVLTTILGLLVCLSWPIEVQAQSILESSDATRLSALIRAKLCEKSCRYGNLTAQRYRSDEIKTSNRYKLYVIKAQRRACTTKGCSSAFVAINNRGMKRLAEGYNLDPKREKIPTAVGTRTTKHVEYTGPRNGVVCQAPGQQLNTAMLKQVFLGKTINGITAKAARWSETLQENGRTRLENARGKVTVGRHQIARNTLCFKYRANESFKCKVVFECTSGEGQYVLATKKRKQTSVITHVTAEKAKTSAPKAKKPVPQAQNFDPLKPLVSGNDGEKLLAGLAKCRAVRSEIRRLNCYDALADNPPEAASTPFRRAERSRLLKLMNFRNLSGVTLTVTSLKGCVLTMTVDAPEVRLSFSNEAVIDLSHLDLRKSRSLQRGQDTLYSFVAKNRQAWKLKTIDKSRKSERTSRDAEVLLAVTADRKDLGEVEGLIKKLAGVCQG